MSSGVRDFHRLHTGLEAQAMGLKSHVGNWVAYRLMVFHPLGFLSLSLLDASTWVTRPYCPTPWQV